MEDCYVKIAHEPQIWLVVDGERKPMANVQEMYEHGLRPVRNVRPEELYAIPPYGTRERMERVAKRASSNADAEDDIADVSEAGGSAVPDVDLPEQDAGSDGKRHRARS